ncbi:MAG: PQQ-binding-like beta-propeller repeat protein [Opitutae bacterium]|nr:PQQ-binding-like beta-propeller repeat protein [Opitutae bacterium]
MKNQAIAAFILCLPLSLLANWLSFRGDSGNGIIDNDLSPSIGTDSKSAWKVELPGRGLSSPIVVGDRVYLTASSGPKQETLHVIAYDGKTGKTDWEKTFKATGRTVCHDKTCVAAPTMVSDGKVVVAQFSSNDVFCLDLEGNLKWLRGLTYDYPNAANGLGMSSSPVIANGVLVAQVENDAESFTAGLSLSNGTTLWKKDRPRGANWTSPTVLGKGKDQQVALQSMKGVAVIDPKTGKDQWIYEDGAATIPSSTVLGSTILVPSNGLTALQARGDGKSHTQLWRDNKLGPGTGSPSISGDKFYVINKANVLTCAEIKTGKIIWRMRLKGPVSSSPVSTKTHLFVFNEEGLGQVVQLGGEEGKTVRSIDLKETILCTPAVSKGALYVRSDSTLWKLSD